MSNDGGKEGDRLTRVEVMLDHDEMAAIEGWRQANNMGSQSDAVRALLRLGLITEVTRTYRAVVALRESYGETDDEEYKGLQSQSGDI